MLWIMYEFNRNKTNPFEHKLDHFQIFWVQAGGAFLRQGSWRPADNQENCYVNWRKVKISYILSMISHFNLSLQYYYMVNLN